MSSKLYLILPETRSEQARLHSCGGIYADACPSRTILLRLSQELGTVDVLMRGEEDCCLYYDSCVLKALLEWTSFFEDEYPSPRVRLEQQLIRMNSRRWDDKRESDSEFCVSIYQTTVANDIVTEAAWQRVHYPQIPVLLMDAQALHVLNADSIKFHVSGDFTTLYSVAVCSFEAQNVAQYFSLHRSPMRVFQENPKHSRSKEVLQDNKIISSLHCSKEHAQKLLHCAVASENCRTLWAFDPVRQQYMEFKCHGSAWHGYHISDEPRLSNTLKEILKNVSVFVLSKAE